MTYMEQASESLFNYLPPLTKKEDFDSFWAETIQITKNIPLNPSKEPVDFPVTHAKVYDISYNGFDSTRINGWFIVPTFVKDEKIPCLIHYHGYTGSRGNPAGYMHWVMMGVAVLAIDCREQTGKTGNNAAFSAGTFLHVMAKGVYDKNEYYVRQLYMDSVKAIDFALAQPEVDPDRIVIEGGSQGGALAMAVCGLDSRPFLVMADVPSNSNIEARVEGAFGSFSGVTEYLKRYPHKVDETFETLSYFDTMNMAKHIQCPVLASVALKDNICPAKMYFATYNRITAEKQIEIYPFNGHEGGGDIQTEKKMRFLYKHLNP
ncbi:MAG: acetylxylan esterase [Clostridiales bacterium 43-6]|nr:MAG: acetylxylan esterase [Clostridiales bacterium 43-6]